MTAKDLKKALVEVIPLDQDKEINVYLPEADWREMVEKLGTNRPTAVLRLEYEAERKI